MNTPPLAGTLLLRPGARDAVRLARPEVARLAIGRPAHELPTLLGLVYTLCSQAHRFTAERALQAARGRVAGTVHERDTSALRTASARDQLLRIAHDWPRLLGGALPQRAPLALDGCPLWRSAADDATPWPALSRWLEQAWLGMPARAWLQQWDAGGAAWTGQWCEAARTPLAALLRPLRALAQAATASGPAWCAQGDVASQMAVLAPQLAQRREFSGDAVVPETGPWSRRHDVGRGPVHNAWVRLSSRIADLLRLAEPGGQHWLAHGAGGCGPGAGIAWTEMARGLLVHWVRIEGPRHAPHTADCRVLAPTDLNFHARGVLAAALVAQSDPLAARLLAAAYDPCLDFRIEARVAAAEAADA